MTRSITLIIVLVLLSGCGRGKEDGTTTQDGQEGMPQEQILYREARQVFLSWLGCFGGSGQAGVHANLSRATQQRLAGIGVRDASGFASWFLSMRESGARPFVFTISHVEILDLDCTDTTRARITASFLLEANGQRRENLGIFTLVREAGLWVVPFGEQQDWEKAWCQLDRQSLPDVDAREMPRHLSQSLDIDFQYPLPWAVTDPATVLLPHEAGPHPGVRVIYTGSGGTEPVAIIAIVNDPAAAGTASQVQSDSLTLGFQTALSEAAGMTDGGRFDGRLIRLINPSRGAGLIVFAGVNPRMAAYANYSQVIDAVLSSIRLKQ